MRLPYRPSSVRAFGRSGIPSHPVARQPEIDANMIGEVRFATDSPLEGAGKRPLATAAMANNVAPRLCRRVAKHAPNASRARDTGNQKAGRWLQFGFLQRGVAM